MAQVHQAVGFSFSITHDTDPMQPKVKVVCRGYTGTGNSVESAIAGCMIEMRSAHKALEILLARQGGEGVAEIGSLLTDYAKKECEWLTGIFGKTLGRYDV
jgi:hypothetical protein